jgi:hypothetical protein
LKFLLFSTLYPKSEQNAVLGKKLSEFRETVARQQPLAEGQYYISVTAEYFDDQDRDVYLPDILVRIK